MRRPSVASLLLPLPLLGLAASCGSSSGQASNKDAAAPADAEMPEAMTDAGSDADGGPGRVITILAEGQNTPYRIAVGGGHVYWTDQQGGTVASAPVDGGVTADGGAATTLVSGLTGQLSGIAVDSNSVYFTETVEGMPTGLVLSVPLSGGTPTTLASGQLDPAAITIDSNNVYWTSFGTGSNGLVSSVPIGGGAITTIASAQVFPGDIAVDDTSVYWTVAGSNPLLGTIMKAPLAGGTAVTLASGQDGSSGLVVTGGSVYWGSQGGEYLASVPVGGGSPTTVVAMVAPVQLAVDSTAVYWTNQGMTSGTDSVDAVPLGSNTLVPLAGQQNGAVGIAVDATSVYFTDTGSGTIMKVTPK